MSKIIFWFDMDGPLAQWDDKSTVYDTWKPGYFRERVLMEPTNKAIKIMKEAGLDVRILSSVYNDRIIEDKKAWLKDTAHLDIPAVFVPYGDDKSKYIGEEKDTVHVLIDDHTPNLNLWRAAGHFGIKFLNHVNGMGKNKEKSWNGAFVSERMQAGILACTIVGTVCEYLRNANKYDVA